MPAGGDRDRCFREEIKAVPPPDWAEIPALRAQVVDPIVGNTALLAYVRDHHKDLPKESEAPLCGPLPETERRLCTRLFESAHLQR
jgi:hypothetical protein